MSGNLQCVIEESLIPVCSEKGLHNGRIPITLCKQIDCYANVHIRILTDNAYNGKYVLEFRVQINAGKKRKVCSLFLYEHKNKIRFNLTGMQIPSIP